MDALSEYGQACETYRTARRILIELIQSLGHSGDQDERRLGDALLKDPERVRLENLPAGTGVSLSAQYAPSIIFDAKGWPRAQEVADAILACQSARQALTRSYERVPTPLRSGIPSPSEIIDRED